MYKCIGCPPGTLLWEHTQLHSSSSHTAMLLAWLSDANYLPCAAYFQNDKMRPNEQRQPFWMRREREKRVAQARDWADAFIFKRLPGRSSHIAQSSTRPDGGDVSTAGASFSMFEANNNIFNYCVKGGKLFSCLKVNQIYQSLEFKRIKVTENCAIEGWENVSVFH